MFTNRIINGFLPAYGFSYNGNCCYSDIDRIARDITFPGLSNALDIKTKAILSDISKNQPTTITDIAQRIKMSESTISRFISRLADMDAVLVEQKGKIKEINLSFTGKLFLKC